MTIFDRDRWLAQTREEAIDPTVPIFDPHHHLWNHQGSRYLIDEFLDDIRGGHRLSGTVYVECQQFYDTEGPEELRPVGETRFIDRLAGVRHTNSGPVDVAAGIVGFADLSLGEAVQPVLEAHADSSNRFRGVRHASAWHEDGRIKNAHTNPPPGLLRDERFRSGVACLVGMGLNFDAWLYHPQLPELAELARRFPNLTVVLNHMAGPLGIGPYEGRRDDVLQEWRKGLSELAACENVYVKLGGRTMTSAGFGWHRMKSPPGSVCLAENLKPYVHACVDRFGPDRCMFESNFPVDRASCSYTVLWNAFKRLSREYTPSERAKLLHDTAAGVYQVGSVRAGARNDVEPQTPANAKSPQAVSKIQHSHSAYRPS